MASQNNINLPSGFGGITYYKEEYSSLFNLKPIHVIGMIILIIAIRIFLPIIF